MAKMALRRLQPHGEGKILPYWRPFIPSVVFGAAVTQFLEWTPSREALVARQQTSGARYWRHDPPGTGETKASRNEKRESATNRTRAL
jgi:hypothetical protein